MGIVNQASKRFLLRAVKWVMVPVGLFFAGYFLLWPFLGPQLNLLPEKDDTVVFDPNT